MNIFETSWKTSRGTLWAISAVLLLGACVRVDTPAAPVPKVPASWHNSSPYAQEAGQTVPNQWWIWLDDPNLNQLIARAIHNSPDRRQALARITEARAQTRNAEAQLFPLIQGVAGVTRTHAPVNRLNNRSAGTFEQFEAGFDAAWEIDVFGRLRQTLEASRARVRATEADEAAITLSLIAEVARQYTLAQLYRQQAALARHNVETQAGIFKISEARYAQGLDSRLELSRAQTLVQSTEAQIPLYQNLAQATAYQLDYLAGDPPGANTYLLNTNRVPVITRDVFQDVPLAVIQRRPDIRVAAENVVAATSLSRATIATLYPTISVSGLLGLTANSAGQFISRDSNNWTLGGSVLAPLFNFGRIRANIDAAKSREEQAVIAYERAVLNALRDVETASFAYQKSRERAAKLTEALTSSNTAVSVARRQYKEGILSQLDVLQAEQVAYATQQDAAQSAADLTQNFIALVKALGLGLEGDESAVVKPAT